MPGKDQESGKPLAEGEKAANSYIRYSGIGFQMIGIIALFTFIGYRIDVYQRSGGHTFGAIFGLAGVCIALFMIIRGLTKK